MTAEAAAVLREVALVADRQAIRMLSGLSVLTIDTRVADIDQAVAVAGRLARLSAVICAECVVMPLPAKRPVEP